MRDSNYGWPLQCSAQIYQWVVLGASRKTAHAILVPHYVHIYIIIFFVCITLCYVIATLAHVYICMDICGNKLLTYLLTYSTLRKRLWCYYYGPEGRPYSNQRVRPLFRLSICHRLFLLMGSTLCSLLLRNYSTDFSNDDTKQLKEQCRCAMYTSFWPWPLHDCRSRSQNRFCEFRCLMGSSLCSLLLRNYSTDFSNDDANQLMDQYRFAT